MAFPTSSLTNNQVHKEGNRSFVYDSTLGVWDQVRETDTTGTDNIANQEWGRVKFPVGQIIQVVWAQTSTILASTSTSYKDLGLLASITPTSTTNKILIQWIIHAHLYTNNSGYGTKLLHDVSGSYASLYETATPYAVYWNSSANQRFLNTWQEIHTPATTNEVTYKIQVSNHDSAQVCYNDANNRSYIQLTEIVA